MTPRFDIFKIEQDGNLYWLEAAADLINAKLRLQQLVTNESTKNFLLLDHMTGNKRIVTADDICNENSTAKRSLNPGDEKGL
jgi:hypothetical protein